MDEIVLDGKKYVSAKRAAKQTGYTKDYIGQLSRAGRLPARMIGRNWYIEESAVDHQQKSTLRKLENGNTGDSDAKELPPPVQSENRSISVSQESPSKVRLIPTQLASRQKIPPVNSMPRFGSSAIAEAFPMRYTVDDRPLIPTPIRHQRTSITVEDVVTVTPKVKQATKTESSTSPSEYVADARAVRVQRYGPPARIVKKEFAATMPVVDSDISFKQETNEIKHFSFRAPHIFLSMIVIVALVALYISFVIQDNRTYSKDAADSYELKSNVRTLP